MVTRYIKNSKLAHSLWVFLKKRKVIQLIQNSWQSINTEILYRF